jgi:hypothetical protein
LALHLEPRHNCGGIHASFDDLDRHLPPNRERLFRQPYVAHRTLSDALEKAIRTEVG